MLDDRALIDQQHLTACPQCDALYRLSEVPEGGMAKCRRCRTLLFAPRRGAILTIVSLATAALILLVVAISAPFLSIEAGGLAADASVTDAALAFFGGSPLMVPLSFAVATLIILLPAIRLSALVYALGPLLIGRRPLPQAAWLFRISMRLRPWAMAEIFMIGVTVALIKIAGMASVEFGAAFWAFAGVVLIVVTKDTVLDERSIWRVLVPDPRQ